MAINKDVICKDCEGRGGPADAFITCKECDGSGVKVMVGLPKHIPTFVCFGLFLWFSVECMDMRTVVGLHRTRPLAVSGMLLRCVLLIGVVHLC